MYINEVSDYLYGLANMGYLTQTEAKKYADKFEQLLLSHQQFYIEMRNNIADFK